jgi:hypothetical protein
MRVVAARVLLVEALAVACAGDKIAEFFNNGFYFSNGEAVLFPPGHGAAPAGAEWWVELSFRPTESHSFLDFSFASDVAGKLPVTTDNSSPITSSGNDVYPPPNGDNRFVLGPMKAAGTPVVRCRNTGAFDNCEVVFTGIAYVDCRSCSEGERASVCNPGALKSTTCTKCDATTAPGTYCTGAKPSYSQRVDGARVKGVPILSPTRPTPLPGDEERPSPVFSFYGTQAVRTCPAGFFCVNGQRTPCVTTFKSELDGGVFCPEGTGADIMCPTGFSCPDPFTKTQCPAGTMCPGGQTEPISCSGGTFQPEAGKGVCLVCPALHHCPSRTQAELCPAGHSCPERTQIAQGCPAGTFAPAGAAACLPCPAGTISLNGPLLGIGNIVCDPCPLGTFQDRSGQTACKTCPAGTVAPSAGTARECQACSVTGTASGISGIGPEIDLAKSTCRCAFGHSGPTCSTRDSLVTPGAEDAPSNTGSTLSSTSGGAGVAGPVIGAAAAVVVVGLAVILVKRRRSAPQLESRLASRLQP